MRNLFFICMLPVILAHCNNNLEKHSSNLSNQKFVKPAPVKDTLYPKNLKAIAKFADTLFIERFYPEIELFLNDDSIHPDRKIDIVFTGSSSIRKWRNLNKDFNDFNALNRGFGGSTIPEVIYYTKELIIKHRPSKIVFYAGENDITSPNTDINKVVQSFEYFQALITQKLPQSHIYFISIKPSPSRWDFWPEMQSINKKIKLLCDSTDNCSYIDVSAAMLNKNGDVLKHIFLADKLHLNKKGYSIWTKIIRETLERKIDKGL